VTSRSPKYNSPGFTLVEMLVVIVITGIILGIAMPSLLALNKPLRYGTLQFKSQLSLIRSKAIASNQAYRIRPKFPNRTAYQNEIPRNFVVEYAANCSVTATGPNGWQMAPQFDVDLPENVGITDMASTTLPNPSGSPPTISVSNSLIWNICFDNRGIASNSPRLIIKDFRGDNQANIALFDISLIGGVDIYTYTKVPAASPTLIPLDTQGNPVF
jgi:prepilin-type N-terminal cleavage/methylation domain-containing protein